MSFLTFYLFSAFSQVTFFLVHIIYFYAIMKFYNRRFLVHTIAIYKDSKEEEKDDFDKEYEDLAYNYVSISLEEEKAIRELTEAMFESQYPQNIKPQKRFNDLPENTVEKLRRGCDLRVRYGSKGIDLFFNSIFYSSRESEIFEKKVPVQLFHYIYTIFQRKRKRFYFMLDEPDSEDVNYLISICYQHHIIDLSTYTTATIYSAVKKFIKEHFGSLIPNEHQDELVNAYFKNYSSFKRRVKNIPYSLEKERCVLLIQILNLVKSVFVQKIGKNYQLLPRVIKEMGFVFFGKEESIVESEIVFTMMIELLKSDWGVLSESVLENFKVT